MPVNSTVVLLLYFFVLFFFLHKQSQDLSYKTALDFGYFFGSEISILQQICTRLIYLYEVILERPTPSYDWIITASDFEKKLPYLSGCKTGFLSL